MHRKILLISVLTMIGLLPVHVGSRPSIQHQVPVWTWQRPSRKDYARLPLAFEPNRGQREPAVKFLSHIGGQTLLLTSTGAELAPAYPNTHSLRMSLAGSNPSPEIEGIDPLAGKVNYFIGNDPAKWRTDVPTFAKVKYHRIYHGVDLVYYSGPASGQLEYDFVVEPGSNPEKIVMAFSGASRISIDPAGDLVLDCFGSEARLHKPHVYQLVNGKRQDIAGHYFIKNDVQVAFRLAPYDVSKTLVIDPTLAFSTYLAGNSGDTPESIAVDSTGNVYVAGGTFSTTFPTLHPIQGIIASSSGYEDAFVTKLNPSGTALIYSTYLGGQAGDHAYAIAVGPAGNVYVAGDTTSVDFPTKNPLQPMLGSSSSAGFNSDVFVAELSAAGDSLVFSTFLGGSGNEFPLSPSAFSMALDSSGNICLAGMTNSQDFPTKNPLQAQSGGGVDFFLTKMKSDGSSLVYSTYLGGKGDDVFAGMTVDRSGAMYVTGLSGSNFPTTPEALPQGAWRIVVSKINAAGTALEYSTYVPAKSATTTAIAVDTTGSVYLAGVTTDPTDFPTTAGAYQTSIFGSDSAGFLAELNPSGTAMSFATFLGDSVPSALILDSTGSAIITGTTASADLAVTDGAVQIRLNNGNTAPYHTDAFLAKLDSSGSRLLYSTYLGGGSDDGARALALDSSGNAYITGSTSSTDFPTTAGAFQANPTPTSGFGGHGFIARIDALNSLPVLSSLSPATATAGGTNAELVVNGANFVLGSVVRWNGSDRPTIFNSVSQLATTIPATDLASAADATITVFNPAPGGGVSNALTLPITALTNPNPTPFISYDMPNGAFASEPGFILTLYGQNFAPNAVVRWNDQDRFTTYIGPGQVTAQIMDSDLAASGTAMVTVFNPAPGGGASPSFPFVVPPDPQPSVAAVSQPPVSAGVPVGSPGVSLTVSGSGFSRSSITSWNGQDRPTTYVSPNSLLVALTSVDLSVPGLAEIRVSNPSPGGGISGPLTVPVYVPLATNDMIYDRFTRKIYASIASTAVLGRANSIATIDPVTGLIGVSVPVGSEPGRLALSDDGQYLYVAITSGNQLFRLDVPSLKAGPMFSLGAIPYQGPLVAADFKVLPRNPEAVAVARQGQYSSDSGIAVYDNGIKRAQEVAAGSGSLAFSGSSSILYSNGAGLGVFNVDDTGVTVRQKPDPVNPLLRGAIAYNRGLLFDSSGKVLDTQSGTLAGTYDLSPDIPTPNISPQSDAGLGRTFFLVPPFINNGRIRAYDQRTFLPAGVQDVVAPQSGTFGSLLRWGTSGLAFRGVDRVYIFRSGLAVQPAAGSQTPALTALNTASAVAGGGNLVLTVIGTGFVPGSVVRWNGEERESEYVDETEILAYMPASDFGSAGQAAVDVMSPDALVSNALSFSVLPLPPAGLVPQPGAPLNAASPQAGAPVAPGSLVSVFGGNLGGPATAGAFPLPVFLGGTGVRINGNYAAMLFSSPGQVNFQVPWEATGAAASSMTVTALGMMSTAVPANVQAYEPGLFTMNQTGVGQGAILINSTGELAAPAGSVPGYASRPARTGDVVSIYCTGLGPVNNRPLTGEPSPVNPLAETTTIPVVLVGGVPATVVFSGLAPGTVGLYQVNVIVPSNMRADNSVPVALTIGGVTSNVVGIALQ